MISKYRIYCETDSKYEYVWGEDAPTKCPVDTAHTVSTVSIVQTIGDSLATIVNDDGSYANFPATAKKTPIFQPSIVPPGYSLYITSAFDDITNAKRGKGNLFAIEEVGITADPVDGPFEKVEGRFLEHVYILGGSIGDRNTAGFKDWIQMTAFAPASAPTSTPGTGNADKVATGLGFNIIVPNANDTGDWTVDGTTLEAGEINQDLAPVPNATQTGYWNWDPTQTPSVTPAAGDGDYDLFDAQLPLVRQANRILFWSTSGDITPSSLKGKKLLPHWLLRFEICRYETGTLKGTARMTIARAKTA
jgi:hypothetical protein